MPVKSTHRRSTRLPPIHPALCTTTVPDNHHELEPRQPRPNDWSVALGDIDGDGNVDLVLGVLMTFQVGALPHSQVLRNNGSGLFTVDPTALPSQGPYDFHSDARLVDLDGDRYLDLVFDSNIAYVGTLFFNDGTGHFGLEPAAGGSPSCFGIPIVVPADMDADGDIDRCLQGLVTSAPWNLTTFTNAFRQTIGP